MYISTVYNKMNTEFQGFSFFLIATMMLVALFIYCMNIALDV